MNYYFKIQTQFIENYGAHREPVTNYWKFKGGSTYFIESESPRIADAVAFLATYLAGGGKHAEHSVSIPVYWEESSEEEANSAGVLPFVIPRKRPTPAELEVERRMANPEQDAKELQAVEDYWRDREERGN